MPGPLALAALSTGIQAGAQTGQSLISRLWNKRDYERQRRDALADWNMQNEYNSPQKQMERLKAAGLNPNLVYGSGATATSSTPVKQSNIAPTQVDLSSIGNAVGTYYNVQQAQQDLIFKKQQTDNLKKMNELADQKKIMMQEQIINMFFKNKHSKFDLGFKEDTRDINYGSLYQRYKNSEQQGKNMSQQFILGEKKGELMDQQLTKDKTLNKFYEDMLKTSLGVQRANIANLQAKTFETQELLPLRKDNFMWQNLNLQAMEKLKQLEIEKDPKVRQKLESEIQVLDQRKRLIEKQADYYEIEKAGNMIFKGINSQKGKRIKM